MKNGHAEKTRLLLQKGADVNMQSMDGDTAIMIALKGGHQVPEASYTGRSWC